VGRVFLNEIALVVLKTLQEDGLDKLAKDAT
jgi:hypothetical protein